MRVCEEDYAWNPSICACECDKDCEVGEYLKNCTSSKSLVDDLVVTWDMIADTPETSLMNPNDKTNYWFIIVVLTAIVCLLLLLVIAIGYYIKLGLTIPSMLIILLLSNVGVW